MPARCVPGTLAASAELAGDCAPDWIGCADMPDRLLSLPDELVAILSGHISQGKHKIFVNSSIFSIAGLFPSVVSSAGSSCSAVNATGSSR